MELTRSFDLQIYSTVFRLTCKIERLVSGIGKSGEIQFVHNWTHFKTNWEKDIDSLTSIHTVVTHTNHSVFRDLKEMKKLMQAIAPPQPLQIKTKHFFPLSMFFQLKDIQIEAEIARKLGNVVCIQISYSLLTLLRFSWESKSTLI